MPLRRRCGATLRAVLPLLFIAAASAAAEPPSTTVEGLTLEAAQQLAVENQPLLEAQREAVQAQHERAIAARALPDPELQTAVNELPVNGGDAGSLSRDSDTDLMVGFMQEFPRGAKRRLRGERADLVVSQGQIELDELARRVRRDAALAFLDAHHAERTALVAEAMVKSAALERDALALRVRSGAATQAELLAVDVESALLRDRVVELRQMAARARRQLERWIGPNAEQRLAFEHDRTREVPSLAALMSALPQHPSVRMLTASQDVAAADIALARQEYRPDWRLEVGYGYRPEFSEMVTVRAAIDLPIFTGNRQDRGMAAARHELAAATARREDRLREISATLAATHDDWRLLGERADNFHTHALPRARSRMEAVMASYRAGRAALAEVIAARRALLDVELQALDLQIGREHRRVELEYFAPEGAQP